MLDLKPVVVVVDSFSPAMREHSFSSGAQCPVVPVPWSEQCKNKLVNQQQNLKVIRVILQERPKPGLEVDGGRRHGVQELRRVH